MLPATDPLHNAVLVPDVASAHAFCNASQVAVRAGHCRSSVQVLELVALGYLLVVEQNSALFRDGQLNFLSENLNTSFTGACSSVG